MSRLIIRTSAGLIFVVLILVGLSGVNNTSNRIATINEALLTVEIPAETYGDFKSISIWLAENTDQNIEVNVSQSIRHGALNIVVTDRSLEAMTGCGHGNAVFDSKLRTIFIDRYLLLPSDMFYLGTDGPSSMFTSDDMEGWVHSLAFILSHELAHFRQGHQSAAFFPLDWLDTKAKVVSTEIEADRIALDILHSAYASSKLPNIVMENDEMIHFPSGLSGPQEVAMGSLATGMTTITHVLQFLSTPHSPMSSDNAHPSLLTRTLKIIETLPFESQNVIVGNLLCSSKKPRAFASLRTFHLIN